MTIGIYFIIFIGTIADGWLLPFLWFTMFTSKVAIIKCEYIRKKLEYNNYIENLLIMLFYGFTSSDFRYNLIKDSKLYYNMQMKEIIYAGLIGGILCFLNAFNNGIWANNALTGIYSNPSLSFIIIVGFCCTILIIDEIKRRRLLKINREGINEEDVLHGFERFGWLVLLFLIGIIIVLMNIFSKR